MCDEGMAKAKADVPIILLHLVLIEQVKSMTTKKEAEPKPAV
eukprot:gene25978-11664_t